MRGSMSSIRVLIKPLSVNKCWQGKRYKTTEYKTYESQMLWLLPAVVLPQPPYEVEYKFGVSSKLADWDNPVKPLQDILQKKYGFDDRDIFRAVVEKEIVPKGEEFIVFDIREFFCAKR